VTTAVPPDGALTAIAARFGVAAQTIERIPTGLIHRTYRVSSAGGERFILQAVNPIFGRAVQHDIDAVTRHLSAKGILAPRLLGATAEAGALDVEAEGAVWRMMSFLDGATRNRLASPEEAYQAARLLARFHSGIADLRHDFKATRLGVHDTARHLEKLRAALTSHAGHRLHAEVAPLGEAVLAAATAIGPLPTMPERVVHGDPKINNLLFDPATGEGRALIDLDTVARMPLAIELGDAFRSWCNPAGEDARQVSFDLGLFEGALRGYRDGLSLRLEPVEAEAIVPATETIMLELAARFLADALLESYFGWDSSRFPARGEHNLLRGRGQLLLARDFAAQRREAERIVRPLRSSMA
jgi:Ser/Thr protein kinase RdoA (MazF antagonist)